MPLQPCAIARASQPASLSAAWCAPAQVEQLDAGLANLHRLCIDAGLTDGADHPGDGAAGGLGFGLRVFAGAELVPGADVVIEALVLTLTVFGCLTLFTMQSKIDFSFLGAGLSSALWILILWGFFAYLFGQPAGGVYSLFGALIFSGYIIFDTYLIAQKLGYDDYILASVTLYLDIVNLFFFILQLLSSNRD